MDVGTRPDWGQFRPGTRSDWCPACGQNCLPGRTFCGVCSSHTDSTVLRVCRSLLLEAANPDGPAAEGDQQGSADHEVAVSYVADQFPLRFARLVGRNASSLKKAGAWFAHVVAFQHTTEEVFQYRAITPDRSKCGTGSMRPFIRSAHCRISTSCLRREPTKTKTGTAKTAPTVRAKSPAWTCSTPISIPVKRRKVVPAHFSLR